MSQAISERLTWVQIRERYPERWVVLVDTQWDADTDFDLDLATATVLGDFTSPTEASPRVKAALAHHEEVGSFWTGTPRSAAPS